MGGNPQSANLEHRSRRCRAATQFLQQCAQISPRRLLCFRRYRCSKRRPERSLRISAKRFCEWEENWQKGRTAKISMGSFARCSRRPRCSGSEPADLADVDVGVVRAVFGVAETGSIWLSEQELVAGAEQSEKMLREVGQGIHPNRS